MQRIACDTVVFTGDWIPDHELARRGGLAMDAATRAPRVDLALRTSARGVFAAGNLLHGAETADVAALGGRHAAARRRTRSCAPARWPERVAACRSSARRRCAGCRPSAISADGATPCRGRFILRVAELCPPSDLVVTQGTRELWRAAPPTADPQPADPPRPPAGSLRSIPTGAR